MTERLVLLRRAEVGYGEAVVVVFRALVHPDGKRIALLAEIQGKLTPAPAAAARRIRDSLLAQLRERGHHVVDSTNLGTTS